MINDAIRCISAARSRPSQRLLDTIYGSQAVPLRAKVASLLAGRQVRPSAKEAQYGNLRTALLLAVGASGDCIANRDADFEAIAKGILGD